MIPKKIYLHWSAGSYSWVPSPSHYHTCITGDSTIHRIHPYDEFQDGHTWHRNSDSVAISLMCMDGGEPGQKKWPCPPKPLQVERMAEEAAKVALKYGIPVDAEHIMTHSEAADLDGYGPKTTFERWDLWGLKPGEHDGGDQLRQKIKWYEQKIKGGK